MELCYIVVDVIPIWNCVDSEHQSIIVSFSTFSYDNSTCLDVHTVKHTNGGFF